MSDNISKSNIVDVIEDFDYSTQTAAYNESFKKWRKKRDNPFAFRFKANKKERVYSSDKGFVKHSADDAEKTSLTKIFYVIGLSVLIWLFFDDVAGKIIVMLLHLFGINVSNNYFDSSITGGNKELLMVLMICGTLKVAIPSAYLHFKFRLPAKVEFMKDLHRPVALIGAISSAFIVCSAASLPSAYSRESKEIYSFFANLSADISLWGQSEFLIYTIFDVIIMSILTECFFRGAMFAVLRQFGDPFAILVTSATAALLTQDIMLMPSMFLISLVAGYGLVSSGTIFTAIAVHIVYKMYSFTLTLIEIDTTDNMPLTRNLFMLIMLVIGSLGLLLSWVTRSRQKKNYLSYYKSEITLTKRLIFSCKTFPYSAVAILCAVYSLIKVIM